MAVGSRQYGDIPMKGATMVLTPPEPSDINDMAKNTPHEAKLVWTTCGRELMNRMRAPIRVILGGRMVRTLTKIVNDLSRLTCRITPNPCTDQASYLQGVLQG